MKETAVEQALRLGGALTPEDAAEFWRRLACADDALEFWCDLAAGASIVDRLGIAEEPKNK